MEVNNDFNKAIIATFTEKDLEELKERAKDILIKDLDDIRQDEYLWSIEYIQDMISDCIEEVVKEELQKNNKRVFSKQ